MSKPSRQIFGYTPEGEPAELVSLDNGSISCKILTFGAALQSLEVPDREGNLVDIVLGYQGLEGYLPRDGYAGATVGRFANRIAGGRFCLNGRDYTLAANNGPNHLHGGLTGFSHRSWRVKEQSGSRVLLWLKSPDGEEGYPGNLTAEAEYRLEGASLSIKYSAVCDADTICSLANHSYFNLSGHGSGEMLGQRLQILAQGYVPVDNTGIPEGGLAPVAGTPMDFSSLTPIGERIALPFEQLIRCGGYDHSYAIEGRAGELRRAAFACSDKTGIAMLTETTLPALQLYTGNFFPEREGKGGCRYAPRHGFCLETQHFPDSPNRSCFPSPILKAGERYEHLTRFTFSVI